MDADVSSDVDADVAAVREIAVIPSILEVVCQATGMGFATVARVTDTRWIACYVLDRIAFGLEAGSELPIRTTLCDEVRSSLAEIVIDDVPNDPVYAGHLTPLTYGLKSYISVPITLSDGSFFGTLCAVDAKPAHLKGTSVVGMFRLFAQLIARHIDDQRQVTESQAQLAETLETAELREQFIAVLGHDLRNPLAALDAGARLLLAEPQSDRAGFILAAMQQTTGRMAALIANLLDLARGRLGGGITIARELRPLDATLEQIIAEVRAVHPDRAIEARWQLGGAISADHTRLGQLFSNLLANAVTHGRDCQPIRIAATDQGGELLLSVANGGDPVPREALARLFKPFYRGHQANGRQGLGLGLYIATLIAQAHGGQLTVASDALETRFTFRMPLRAS